MPPRNLAYLDGMIYGVEILYVLSRDYPIFELELSNKYLFHPVWENRTPAQCLLACDEEHIKRINNNDLNIPLLREPLHGRIIDGYHRIVLAILSNKKFLKVKNLTEADMQTAFIRKMTEEELQHHNQTLFGKEK